MKSKLEILQEIHEENLSRLLALRINKRYYATRTIKEPKDDSITKKSAENQLLLLAAEDMLRAVEAEIEEVKKEKK